MANPKFQHTIQLPDEVEQAWQAYQSEHGISFNAFAIALLRRELECACVPPVR